MKKRVGGNLIWHFTKPEILHKILAPSGGGLLSSHLRFLDDETDGELCRPIAEEAGEILFHLLDIPPGTPTGNLRQWLRGLANRGIKLSVFATCFCRRIESPFMWRVYTGAGGYAIGFQRRRLVSNLISQPTISIKARNCSYPKDISAQRARFSELNNRIIKLLPAKLAFAMADTSPNAPLIETLFELQQLALDAAFIKHRFYRDEKEFRIVQSPVFGGLHELAWVNGKPCLPLKTKIPLADLVEEIVVSPLGNVQQNLNAALLLAEATHIGCHKVRRFSPS